MAHTNHPDHAGLPEFRHGHPDHDGHPDATRVTAFRDDTGYRLVVTDRDGRADYRVDALVVNNNIKRLDRGGVFHAANVVVVVGPAKNPKHGLLAWVTVV